jgi:hypothetical protein
MKNIIKIIKILAYMANSPLFQSYAGNSTFIAVYPISALLQLYLLALFLKCLLVLLDVVYFRSNLAILINVL